MKIISQARSTTRALLCAVALGVVGCGDFPGQDVDTVYAASTELAAPLRASLSRLYVATGILVYYNQHKSGSVPFTLADLDDGDCWLRELFEGGRDPNVVGRWDAFTRDVTISPEIAESVVLETIVLHELLHALGADHVDQSKGVLSPILSGPQALTDADLVEVCARRQCQWMLAE